MNVETQISEYLNGLTETKRLEMEQLHCLIVKLNPENKLWYLDGYDENGKQVSNPNIGYGMHTFQYANGTHRDFYKIGISANATGISVYIMGLEDKNYLKNNYEKTLGKAKITSYCIHFKSLKDIDIGILLEAISKAL